jgi:CubicO group peptidase (beta-lactamase class C family)
MATPRVPDRQDSPGETISEDQGLPIAHAGPIVLLGYLPIAGRSRTNVFHLPVKGSGDGGIYSTAADISALWQSLFTGRIVPARWVAEMVRPRSDVPAQSKRYGLGFWLGQHSAIPSSWTDSTPVFHSGACTTQDRPLPAP